MRNYALQPEAAEYLANNFSSFEGEDLYYTGLGDDHLDFGGPNRSFADLSKSERIFVINLNNQLSTTETVVLFPGYTWYPGATGNNWLKDGVIKTVGDNSLSASGSPKAIAELLGFVMKNPTTLHAMRFNSSDPGQVSQQMVYKELSPFKDLQSRVIDLGAYINENTYKDKMVTVPMDVVISSDVELSIPILANSTCTITLFFGVAANQSQMLQRKFEKARATIQHIGLGNVRRLENTIKLGPKALKSFEGDDEE